MSPATRCDLLITGGTVLDLARPEGRADAAIVIDDGRIVALDERPDATSHWEAHRRIDADGAYVAPGFVDGHVHLSAILGTAQPYVTATGASTFGGGGSTADIGRTLEQFLSIPVPAELVDAVVAPVLASMVLSGTTVVVDAGSAGIDGVVSAARRVGIRVAVGPHVHDLMVDDDGATERVAEPAAVIERVETWLTQGPTATPEPGAMGELVEPSLAVTEPTYCSDEMLAALGGLLERTDASVTFHSHETDVSVRDHDRIHGRPAIDRLAEHGLLGPHCTLMHAGAVDDRDIEAIAASDTIVNLNPLGNAMLGFGVAHRRAFSRLVEAGVSLRLGSDQMPSMIASGFDLVHAALMATREAAGSDFGLTLEQALPPALSGRLEPGAAADVIIVDHQAPHYLGVDHPVPGLALRARPNDVRTVVVGGRVVVDDHALTTLDIADLRSNADAALDVVRSHQ